MIETMNARCRGHSEVSPLWLVPGTHILQVFFKKLLDFLKIYVKFSTLIGAEKFQTSQALQDKTELGSESPRCCKSCCISAFAGIMGLGLKGKLSSLFHPTGNTFVLRG